MENLDGTETKWKTTLIIIYCAKGARGALAAESLLNLGYKNVLNLEGGYGAFNPNPDKNAPVEEEGGCGWIQT